MGKCNCIIKNGSDVKDLYLAVPGGTEADATYLFGLTHYTCGCQKMLIADVAHPVKADLSIQPVGLPVDVGNGTLCQEFLISGTVTYCPCGSCRPETEYVTYSDCAPCSSPTQAVLALGEVIASPKPIIVYERTSCGCCQKTLPSTNQIVITTSINVTPGK